MPIRVKKKNTKEKESDAEWHICAVKGNGEH